MKVPIAHTLRGLSALLAYPDAALRDSVPSIRQWLDTDDRVRHERAALHALLDGLWLDALSIDASGREAAPSGPAPDEGADALITAQETYVETFDRGRRSSLSLFEHVHGDGRDRGQAMVDLLGMYRQAGLDYAAGELPDYLPAYLEFASLQPESNAKALLQEVDHILAAIGSALAGRQSPYAAVFATLLRLAGVRDPASRLTDRVEDDRSPAAMDRAWAEEPVSFLGAASPQSGCKPPGATPDQEQPIRIIRRAA
jgi:nitrate reductase molybdenum cofactor assembly chaperone NarJ/NarW